MKEGLMQEPVDPATRRKKLSPERQALLDDLLSRPGSGSSEPGAIPRRSKQDRIPLSFAQQRLWFLQRLDPTSTGYNVPIAFRLVGNLDVSSLRRSFNEILRRHAVLRATIAVVNDEPVQCFAPHAPVDLRPLEMTGPEESDRNAEAMEFAVCEARTPFDLKRGPLFRVHLLRLRPDLHIFILTVHHIVFDGWSVGVFFRELGLLYGAFSRTLSTSLPELAIEFGDYVVWQREQLCGRVLDAQLGYWKTQLVGSKGVLELPGDRRRLVGQPRRGGDRRVAFPKRLSEELQLLSRRNGMTLFMTLAAAFEVFLHRITGEDDFLVGTPVAGRNRPELEELIGFFVNTLILRADLSGNPPFLELLRRVRETALGAFANQDVPFERLVEELHPERVPGGSPLIQVMFVLQNAPTSALELPGLAVTGLELSNGASKFDLTLTMTETAGVLESSFEYDADMFEPAAIDRMAERFQVLLEGIVRDPARRISELPLMTSGETQQVLVDWDSLQLGSQSDRWIHYEFEDQAAQAPGGIAVSCGDQHLQYRDLNVRANQLAHHLVSLGVGPEIPVGVCMERSSEMIVALLGILKAGGCYVPLDPQYPRERVKGMILDAGIHLVVVGSGVRDVMEGCGVLRVCVETDRSIIERCDKTNPEHRTKGSHRAYIMFTSGSTGRPKGVFVSHGALASHCLVCRENYGIGPRDRVLQFASLSFDPSVEQIFTALTAGAELVVRGEDVWSARDLYDQIIARGLTVVNLPTAYWNEITRDVPAADQARANHALRLVIVGGESMMPEPLMRWRRGVFGSVRLLNAYGPTETTVTALLYDCGELPTGDLGASTRIPIGRPLRNRSAYVLDKYGSLSPIGIPGELHIGGPTLAGGYLNQPGLTAERFVRNHIDCSAESLLYKTGDLVRLLPDGNIEFLGRVDEQVKIRGYRIEPREIESVLKENGSVRDAAVKVLDGPGGEKITVAYCVGEQERALSIAEIRSDLEARLPGYMIPSAIVIMERFPVLPNGKIDLEALPPPPTAPERRAAKYVAPRDPLETQLTALWESLLGRKPIGVHDNFFDLGGHSLLAARLFAQIERLTGKNLPLAILFRAPTIDGLSALIRRDGGEALWSSLVPIKPAGTRPPLYCVHAAGGNVIGYQTLASYLEPDQPVYGLQARGLDGKEAPLGSVGEMAASYIEEIRALQPEGPYYLGGACTGGIVAFEMAQQLVAGGQQVGILAMFDTIAHTQLQSLSRDELRRFKRESAKERLKYHAVNLLLHAGRINYVRKKLKTLRRRFRSRVWRMVYRYYARQNRRLPHALMKVQEFNMIAIKAYNPHPFPGRITLFSPISRSVGEFKDREQGWGRLALGGVDVHHVTGDHLTMLKEPDVQIVARKLSESLSSARQRYISSKVEP